MPSDLDTKQSVLDTAKAMVECGLVEGTSGNVSARLSDGRVVLTPSSLDYESMSMDDLVMVNVHCPDLSLYNDFNEVYRTYFTDHFPARAFLGSGPLLLGGHFEATAIAVRQ